MYINQHSSDKYTRCYSRASFPGFPLRTSGNEATCGVCLYIPCRLGLILHDISAFICFVDSNCVHFQKERNGLKVFLNMSKSQIKVDLQNFPNVNMRRIPTSFEQHISKCIEHLQSSFQRCHVISEYHAFAFACLREELFQPL